MEVGDLTKESVGWVPHRRKKWLVMMDASEACVPDRMDAQDMQGMSYDVVEQANERRYKLGTFNRKLTLAGEERTLGR
jgi:hypothetical protein